MPLPAINGDKLSTYRRYIANKFNLSAINLAGDKYTSFIALPDLSPISRRYFELCFDQQLRFLDADLDVWRSMTEISLDDLCASGIISLVGMYCDFLHLMVNKEQVLEGLKTESHGAVERLKGYDNMINGVFHQLRCQLIIEGGELIEDKAVLAMFTKVIRLQLEADNFDFDMIDVLTGYKTSLDHLQSQLIEYKNVIAESTNLNQKVTVVAQHTGAPDEVVVRESLQKFADFVNTL